MNPMTKIVTLGVATLLLLAVDWFAFHDVFEPHTFRDYLTLSASFVVFFDFGAALLARHQTGVTE